MSDERRYDEREMEEIFQLAAETRDASIGGGSGSDRSRSGLTLHELQEIGEEVGISRVRIAEAARTVGDSSVPARKVRTLGLPIDVERTVGLQRPLSDLEWERLVVRLRRTFRARGRVELVGRIRQWSNGNLNVAVEPTESGYQLRLQTSKGSVRPMLSAAFATTLAAAVLVVVGLASGTPINMFVPAFLAVMGVGVAGVTLGALPSWANKRAAQMEEIGDVVREWTALPPESSDE